MTAATDPLTTEALRLGDAAAAFALSTEAGWNQTVGDWQFMIEVGEAQGQFTPSADLVASALVLPYGDRIAWIGMVLTTAAFRRRGLATENLRWAIARCDALGLIAGLDATPAGREVYRPLGFTDLWGLQRLRADRAELPGRDTHGAAIRPMQDGDLAQIAALDAEAFGAGRSTLLAHLHRSLPTRAWVVESGEEIAGFVLGRAGRTTHHLGPLIARDAEIAWALVGRTLEDVEGPVSIDVPDHQDELRTRLARAGFAAVRPFTRMLRCSEPPPGDAALSFAIAGPELG